MTQGRGAERERFLVERNDFVRRIAQVINSDSERAAAGFGDLATVDDGAAIESNARVAVEDDGTLVGARRRLNFSSTTLAITITDDGSNERVNVQIEAADELPAGSAGDMLVHDGSSWVTLPAGEEGQVLHFVDGAPVWKFM